MSKAPEIPGMKAVSELPSLKREKFLARVWKHPSKPTLVKTDRVEWNDEMTILMMDEEPITSALVYVNPLLVTMVSYVARMEMILDCCIKGARETIVKYNVPVLKQNVEMVQFHLFDTMIEANSETGEMTGAMKLKHKSVKHGVARLRLKLDGPDGDYNLQVIIRHMHPQGVKGLLWSVLSRVNPQYKSANKRHLSEVQLAWRERYAARNDLKSAKAIMEELFDSGAPEAEVLEAIAMFEEANGADIIASEKFNSLMGGGSMKNVAV